jgi:signal transduction histidine kinase/DNA-binding NarL/FixJ family response regulator
MTLVRERPGNVVFRGLGRRPEPTDGAERTSPADRVSALQNAWALRLVILTIAGFIVLTILSQTLANPALGSLPPRSVASIEVASAVARLFAALVLVLFPVESFGNRLRWIAVGLIIMAVGGLLFGFLPAMYKTPLTANSIAYQRDLIRLFACAAFAVGLIARTPVTLTRLRAMWIGVAYLTAGFLVGLLKSSLPPLMLGSSAHPRFTALNMGIGLLTLAISLLAVWGAAVRTRSRSIYGWILLAMIVMLGSVLESILWPAQYSPSQAGGSLLRLVFALVVAVGALVQLKHFADERERLLVLARESNDRLSESDIIKANFTRMIAHELGQPIAAINRFADLLGSHDFDVSSVRRAIKLEADNLSELLGDVHHAAIVEEYDFAVKVKPTSLRKLIGDAVSFANTLPGRHPVTIHGSTDTSVLADTSRVGQVLRNLLSNAAKFSKPGTPIDIQVSESAGRVGIAVKDHGPGISLGDTHSIFEKFNRGSGDHALGIPGTGLGLYLSRSIVRAHGSDLTLRSSPQGATFSFTLDRADQEADMAPELDQAVRLLLVDDHGSFRQSLIALLRRYPEVSSIVGAGTIAEARQLCENVDIILLDLDLPDGNSIDFIREVNVINPSATVIILSASTAKAQFAAAVEAGARGLLHKSESVDAVLDFIKRTSAGESLLTDGEIVELLREVKTLREEDDARRLVIQQLTDRELDVLRCLADGLSDKQIADRLVVAPSTARTHVVRVLQKLQAHSRLQAVVIAARYGAIEIK